MEGQDQIRLIALVGLQTVLKSISTITIKIGVEEPTIGRGWICLLKFSTIYMYTHKTFTVVRKEGIKFKIVRDSIIMVGKRRKKKLKIFIAKQKFFPFVL